jgi:ribulose-phosphate 3-epimerase
MSRFRIAPSILSADFGRLAEEVRDAEAAGADWIHVDVMDGHFVPNLTIGPDVVAAIGKATTLPLDVHLMIERPERFIERFVQAGAGTVGVQIEACRHVHGIVQQIHAAGARACVVLNPGTPASALDAILGCVDQVLVMTVNPGFGGVGLDTVEQAAIHGAEVFVMGAAFFGSEDRARFAREVRTRLAPYEDP